jgi:hypothetical protein
MKHYILIMLLCVWFGISFFLHRAFARVVSKPIPKRDVDPLDRYFDGGR